MLAQVHEHIMSELGQSNRTDTLFVLTAVVFNLLVLAINSAAASASNPRGSLAATLVLVIFIGMTLLVDALALVALALGARTRGKLLAGLNRMYSDHHVNRYYDGSLLTTYIGRYVLFGVVIVTLGFTAIIVPLIIRFVR